jgi:hypothetical protein
MYSRPRCQGWILYSCRSGSTRIAAQIQQHIAKSHGCSDTHGGRRRVVTAHIENSRCKKCCTGKKTPGEPGHTRDTKYCTGKTESLSRPRGAVGSGAAAVESGSSCGRACGMVWVLGSLHRWWFGMVWDGCEVRLCDPCASVSRVCRVCVPCVSRLPPLLLRGCLDPGPSARPPSPYLPPRIGL